MPGVAHVMLERRWVTLQAEEVDGQLLATTPDVAPDQVWMIDIIALSVNPPVACTCALYHGDVSSQNFITRSLNAAEDTYEGAIEVPGGDHLSFAWTGKLPAAASVTAKIHYARFQVVLNPTDPTLLTWRGPR